VDQLAERLGSGGYRWALVKLYLTTGLYSAFLNNTAVVASLIGPPLPVTAAALVGRDDRVAIAALTAAFRADRSPDRRTKLIDRLLAVEPLRRLLFLQARQLIIRTAERRSNAGSGGGGMDPNMEEFLRRFGIPMPNQRPSRHRSPEARRCPNPGRSGCPARTERPNRQPHHHPAA
jgi:hypothetical protein